MNILKNLWLSSLFVSTLISTHLYAAPASPQQIKQLMEITHIEKIGQETMQQLQPVFQQQADSMVKNYLNKETLNQKEQNIANEIAAKLYQSAQQAIDWKKIQPILATIYAEVFTAQEIQAQINFYSTTEGQSILQKSPLVTKKALELTTTQLMQSMQTAETNFTEINKKLKNLKTN